MPISVISAIARGRDRVASAPLLAVPPSYPGRPFEGAPGATPTTNFVLLDNQRWFEPDAGDEIEFSVNPSGWSASNPDLDAAVSDALASWSEVPGCAMRLRLGTDDTSGCGWRADHHNRISVDCDGFIAGSGCSSVIASAGPRRVSSETRVVNGVTFRRVLESDLVLQDGFCDLFVNPSYLRFVLAHELGHCIGLGHSSDPAATMYFQFSAPNGERGAELSEDDRDGARFIYPGETAPPALEITSPDPGEAMVGRSYAFTFEASGGTPDYTWSVGAGVLPEGLALSPAGMLAGTPDAAGDFAISVVVRDASGATASRDLRLRVADAPHAPLRIPAQTNPTPVAGNDHEARLRAEGGRPPYRWRLSAGDLPPGLTLAEDGLIAGSPERAGTWLFNAVVEDADAEEAEGAFTLVVDPSPVVVTSAVYTVARRSLTIATTSFGPNLSIRVNGSTIELPVKERRDRGRLKVRATREALHLTAGRNVIQVAVDGVWSEVVECHIR